MNSACRTSQFSRWVICLSACFFSCSLDAAGDPPPLHAQIDALITKRHVELKITPAAISDDAEFLRRVFLDLTGVIPTAKQAREFLEDSSPNKRQKLIDELLKSPNYALHMARVFDVMLTERRTAEAGNLYDVPSATWRAYLAESFAENKPWDRMVHEILASDGTEEKLAGAVKFYLVRNVSPHQLTRDVGRLFLGMDLQCAQCHDDPHVEEYHQADYFGIYAFLQRLKRHPMSPRGAQIAEVAEGKTAFISVFTTESGETNPRLPGGDMLADPPLEKGKEYIVKPAPKVRSVPTYSRRLKLAEQLPRPETRGFSRNIANRLWAVLMGKGLVHPLDLHHAGNPPSDAELLATLEQWLVAHHYDIKGFLREVILSDTYQRSSVLPLGVSDLPEGSFAVAPLRGLHMEQLRWSILQATGRIESHYANFESQSQKDPPMPMAASEPAWKVRATHNEALERQTASLSAAFASLPGQPEAGFQPIVDQALYLQNSEKLLPLLQANPGTVLDRLNLMTDVSALAEELYLSVLSRRPTAEETAEVKDLVESAANPADRRETLQALLWGLLLSAEFRLNH